MPIPKIHEYDGIRLTVRQWAKRLDVDLRAMRGRMLKLKKGKMSPENVFTYGRAPLSARWGNAEFNALPDLAEGRPENLAKIKVGKFDSLCGEEEARWVSSNPKNIY